MNSSSQSAGMTLRQNRDKNLLPLKNKKPGPPEKWRPRPLLPEPLLVFEFDLDLIPGTVKTGLDPISDI